MTNLNIAFSTCPNDTFLFHAMLHGLVDTKGMSFKAHLDDVEALNSRAFSGDFHITKLSFFAYLKLKKTYELLDSGSALGYGCGPLLVSRDPGSFAPDSKIAIPGEFTTAHLLLKLWNPEIKNTAVTRFDNILEGVQSGKYDAGLIIHEGRFVYNDYDCGKIVDLGEWWEEETGLPIPLGCIAVQRSSPAFDRKKDIEAVIKNSVQYAFDNRGSSKAFVREHAQELDDDVINGHIDLYVNDFTLSHGDKGTKAVKALEEMARWKKIL